MAELPFEDERVQAELQVMMRHMNHFIGEPLTSFTVTAIKDFINDFRNKFKTDYGYEFPPLVPLILPRSQFIAWFRADLDDQEIQYKILNLLREFNMKHIPVSEFELAQAIKLAWPHYNPHMEYYRKAAQVNMLH